MTLGDFSVTLMGYSYMDLMSSLVGAYFYQVVWYSLSASGLFLLPFFMETLQAIRQSLEDDGLNDAPMQHWGRYWVKMVIMFLIMLFAAAPTIKVNELAIRMQLRECDSNAREIGKAVPSSNFSGLVVKGVKTFLQVQEAQEYVMYKDSVNGFASQLTMGGKQIRVPVWWYFWRQTMLAVSSHITAQLPCDDGLRALKNEIATNFIQDEVLANDLAKFMSQCTMKAKAILQQKLNGAKLEPIAFLPNYIWYFGADTFYPSIQAQTPVWGFGVEMSERGYDPKTAPNSVLPTAPAGYGYPMCDKWWNDSAQIKAEPLPNVPPDTRTFRGLEDRLYDYYDLKDPAFCGKYVGLFDWRLFGETSPTCDNANGSSQNTILTAILNEQLLSQSESSLKAQKLFATHMGDLSQWGSHNATTEGNKGTASVFGQVLDIGLITSAWKDFAGNYALLKALPIATSMLVLVVTALIPIAMVVGRYEVEPVLGLTISYCSFMLWIPYFRMMRWLDDNFVGMIVSGYQVNMQIMLEMMIAVAYVGVPMLMASIMTVVGVRIAQVDPIGGDKMGSIANKAATNIINLTTSIMSKGTKGKGGGGANKKGGTWE